MSSADKKTVIVIGGGLAGLSAAVDLRSRGLDVTVVEQNLHLGGKMNVLEDQGFTFDMGPTILTLPEVLCGVIRRAGRTPAEEIDLIRLDPQWRCMYEDGTVIDLKQDLGEMARSLEAQFPRKGAGEGFKSFIEYSRRMNRLSREVFYYKDVGSVTDVMKQSPMNDFGLLKDVLAMRLHSTVGGTVHKHINEPHVQQMCEHFQQYVGSSPFLAPAILSLIASAQVDQGCWYSMGGTRQVARTLERIGRESGVEFITGVKVAKITHDGSRATGVELADGRSLQADVIVSNCDVQRTMKDLLDTPKASKRLDSIKSKYTPACSGLVLYLGLNKRYDHLAHHDFLFSADSEAEFDDIYHKGLPARDPTLYLCVPSRSDPAQAPEGCEALYVLIHTPYKREGQVWEGEHPDGSPGLLETYRPIVMNKLKRFGMEDIEDHIVVERHLTPDSIDRMYNAEGGAIYGLASHGKLHGGFKPNNRSKVFDNLYLAGGSANPGPGVPMVLMSGVTAASTVCQDLGMGATDVGGTSGPPESPIDRSAVGEIESKLATAAV